MMKADKNAKKILSAGVEQYLVVTRSDFHLQKIFVNLHLFRFMYQARCVVTVGGTVSF